MSIKMFTVTAFCFSVLHDNPIFVQIAGISQFHSFKEAQVSKFKQHRNNPMITSVKENWIPLDQYMNTQGIDTEILKLIELVLMHCFCFFSCSHYLIRDRISEVLHFSTLHVPFMSEFPVIDTNLPQP